MSLIFNMARFRTIHRASWLHKEDGAALPEFALLFPVLLTMIMGVYDVGKALTLNQKVISASQMIGDLITRQQSIQRQDLQDIIMSGELAIDPYDREPFGYDIVSIEFDSRNDPIELWRVTDNMPENDDIFDRVANLGEDGEGVVAVTISYTYKPFFTDLIKKDVVMKEVAILRGRRSAIVTCNNC